MPSNCWRKPIGGCTAPSRAAKLRRLEPPAMETPGVGHHSMSLGTQLRWGRPFGLPSESGRPKGLSHLLSIILTTILGGLLTAALVRNSPGFDSDERLLDPRLDSASIAAIRAEHAASHDILRLFGRHAAWRLWRVALPEPAHRRIARGPPAGHPTTHGRRYCGSAGRRLWPSPSPRSPGAAESCRAPPPRPVPAHCACLRRSSPSWSSRWAVRYAVIPLVLFPRLFDNVRNLLANAYERPHILTARAKGVSTDRYPAPPRAAGLRPGIARAGRSIRHHGVRRGHPRGDRVRPPGTRPTRLEGGHRARPAAAGDPHPDDRDPDPSSECGVGLATPGVRVQHPRRKIAGVVLALILIASLAASQANRTRSSIAKSPAPRRRCAFHSAPTIWAATGWRACSTPLAFLCCWRPRHRAAPWCWHFWWAERRATSVDGAIAPSSGSST